MKLPDNSLIAPEKLTQYLLILKKRNDKSKWLAQGGYTLENWPELGNDLRAQILSLEAIVSVTVKLYTSEKLVKLYTPFGH